MKCNFIFIMALMFCLPACATDWSVATGYSSNMTITLRLWNGEAEMAGVTIGAFAGDECRAVGTTGTKGVAVLTIQGERYGEQLSFRVKEKDGGERLLPLLEIFVADQILGAKEYPYDMQLDCILPADVRPGGRYARPGSLNGKKLLQLGGEGWTTGDIRKLRSSFASDDIRVQTVDFRGVAWRTGCDISGFLTGCKELTTVHFSALPGSACSYNALFSGSNPNCLIYVPDDAKTGDWKNVVKGTEAEKVVLVEGHPFECARSFNAGKVSYARRFALPTEKKVSAGWETIILPFEATLFKSATKGKLLPFTHRNLAKNRWSAELKVGYKPFRLSVLDGDTFKAVSGLKANTPYIIAMPNDGNSPEGCDITGEVIFSGENTTVYTTLGKPAKTTGTRFELLPAYRRIPRTAGIYCLNREPVQGLPAGSAFVDNARVAEPFEVYARPRTPAARAAFYRIEGDLQE